MGLIDDIRAAQVEAAENIVIQSLKDKGLMPDDTPQPQTPKLGDLIDQWIEQMAKVRDAEAHVRELKKEAEKLQSAVSSNLDDIGLEMARGSLGSAFFTESETIKLEDPQEFGEFVVRTNQPFLYQARVMTKAVAELMDMGEEIPGVKRLPIRKLSYKTGNK